MKAIEYRSYGSPEVLKIIETSKPSPKENEILLRIKASSVTTTECLFRKGKPFVTRLFTGLTKPKITRLGEELSGVVESIGKNVKSFKVGDQIFGTAGPNFGANAEYICLPENSVITAKPNNIGYEEAASSCDGVLTALPFLRDKANIKSGQKILIYGASGSIGTAAVQLSKYFGAEVTGVCSGSNYDLVKSLGADKVIDYTKDDFTKSQDKFDIVFDAVGKTTFPKCKSLLKENGIFLEVGIGLAIMPHVFITSLFGKKKAKIAATGLRKPSERKKDLIFLKELMELGRVKPVVDRTYSFEQIMDAHHYVDKGHKKGNVAISF